MDNTLMVYLNKRLNPGNQKLNSANGEPGPVICISREVGCGALNIAKMLAAEFEKQSHGKKWKVISKEILEESARELDMAPDKLTSFLKNENRSLFEEILTAFNEKRYKSDKRIRKTLIDLITSFANDGNCIIVGRAGHIIARDIEKSLMIRLTAPLEWRVKQIMEKNNLNNRQAFEFIEKTEQERHNLRKHIAGEAAKEDVFDLTFNLARMDVEDVIAIIRFAAQAKGLIEIHKSKAEIS